MVVVSADFTDEVSCEVSDGLTSISALSVIFSGIVWYVVCRGNTGGIDGQLEGKLQETYRQIQGIRVSNLGSFGMDELSKLSRTSHLICLSS